jgi:predicted nuclease of predicted toxin-antitoxin system
VKLLFDQNLSHRLVEALQNEYPDSKHVRDLGLSRASDSFVWAYASDNGFTLVSKDADFHQLSLLHGAPPKVIWVRRGNCTTDEFIDLLRAHRREIEAFESEVEASFLALS